MNGLDGPEVVDSRVESDLVEDQDAGVDGLLVESLHGVRDVRSCDDVDVLVPDGGLDDEGVVGVGDEGDDEVVLSDKSVEFSGVSHVDRDRVGAGNGGREGEGGGESSAS